MEERVLQGCFFLSNLFKLNSEMILRGQEKLSVFNLGGLKHNNVPTQTKIVLSVAFEKELFGKFVDENMKKGLTSNYNKRRYLFVCKRPIPRCLRRIGGIKSENCGNLVIWGIY